MHNLIRIYNQNRIKIWIIVIGIIISITVIQNLNKSIRDENNKKNNKIHQYIKMKVNQWYQVEQYQKQNKMNMEI